MSENKDVLQCGVVGVGHMGSIHARVYSELPQTELAGVYDPDDGQAQKICAKYRCRRFATLEEMAEACDAATVAVPTDMHCEVALELLSRGVHLLIEKPICTSLDEAERILAMADKKGALVQVGHSEHFNPVMSFLEENVADPRYITAERLAPFNPRGTEVGVVLDLMIHDIGIILRLVRSKVKKVDSVGVNVLSSTEDIANARIEFENGCVANVSTSRVSLKKVRKIRVFQPRTYLSMDFLDQAGYLLVQEGERPTDIKRRRVPIEKGEALPRELGSFADAILQAGEVKVPGSLGKTALELATKITEQIQAAGLRSM